MTKKSYRHSKEAAKQADILSRKQYADGTIGDSKSPYKSPICIIPKKMDASGEKKFRVVVDFRAFNEKVIGDAYPLPNILDILDQLGKAKYFSVFNLASGFHQIETHPEDRAKTAFSTPIGHFEYLRMPKGIKDAPATFQRLMDKVLKGMQGSEVFVYLDDIILHSQAIEEHDAKIRRLCERLRQA